VQASIWVLPLAREKKDQQSRPHEFHLLFASRFLIAAQGRSNKAAARV
jgi:hypothetical protein